MFLIFNRPALKEAQHDYSDILNMQNITKVTLLQIPQDASKGEEWVIKAISIDGNTYDVYRGEKEETFKVFDKIVEGIAAGVHSLNI